MRAFVRYIIDALIVIALLAVLAGFAAGYLALITILFIIVSLLPRLSPARLTQLWSKFRRVGTHTPPRRHP